MGFFSFRDLIMLPSKSIHIYITVIKLFNIHYFVFYEVPHTSILHYKRFSMNDSNCRLIELTFNACYFWCVVERLFIWGIYTFSFAVRFWKGNSWDYIYIDTHSLCQKIARSYPKSNHQHHWTVTCYEKQQFYAKKVYQY